MTTVGYGDLTAGGNLGRALVVLDALLGQLYLVTVVALLVSQLGRVRLAEAGRGRPSTAPARTTESAQPPLPDPARALARATVSLGDSPNSVRYCPANRPRCQKPKSDAARVTASRTNGPSRSVRRTSSSAATRR